MNDYKYILFNDMNDPRMIPLDPWIARRSGAATAAVGAV